MAVLHPRSRYRPTGKSRLQYQTAPSTWCRTVFTCTSSMGTQREIHHPYSHHATPGPSRNANMAEEERIDWAAINKAATWEPYSSSDEIADQQFFSTTDKHPVVGQRDLKIWMMEQQMLFELLIKTAVQQQKALRNPLPELR